MIALHRVAHVNDLDQFVGEEICVNRVALTRQPENHARWRQLIDSLDALHAPASIGSAPQQSLARRIEHIRVRLARERSIRFQRSLFDGRADAAAARRADISAALDAALVRVLRSVIAPISIERGRPSLIAMWPERRR